jgi:hypothetical protein
VKSQEKPDHMWLGFVYCPIHWGTLGFVTLLRLLEGMYIARRQCINMGAEAMAKKEIFCFSCSMKKEHMNHSHS